jgi:hypothetical protein
MSRTIHGVWAEYLRLRFSHNQCVRFRQRLDTNDGKWFPRLTTLPIKVIGHVEVKESISRGQREH